MAKVKKTRQTIFEYVQMFNSNIDQLVRQMYHDDCVVIYPDIAPIFGTVELLEFLRSAWRLAPQRIMKIDHLSTAKNRATLEASIIVDPERNRNPISVVIVFRFSHGRIREETVYTDTTNWSEAQS